MCVCAVLQDEFGAKDYSKLLELRVDHVSRPIWVVRWRGKDEGREGGREERDLEWEKKWRRMRGESWEERIL